MKTTSWLSTVPICGLLALAAYSLCNCATSPAHELTNNPKPEVRGTWITTTANEAVATPANTTATMKRLREIGINTVYVECWKNGYTQYPSKVLERVVGVDRHPALTNPLSVDATNDNKTVARDLVAETLSQARANELAYIAWFEYGFMAAHKSTNNHLRRMKKEWLSLDKDGNEVAPNGFVWMNPLHPQARRFLLDLVLEAVASYDFDGIQLDDRIVWPYITMGYDEYTKSMYAKEHGGRLPPVDYKDPQWMRWRADKVNEFSKMFVQEVRKAKPSLIISLSPAPFPWCYENYLLEWPRWASWTAQDALNKPGEWSGNNVTPIWDEFIPQCYRLSYNAYAKTWNEQVHNITTIGGGRIADLIAGIRVVGDGTDSSWEDLRKSIELVRNTGGGGHVLWFSRGVTDVYPNELAAFYDIKKTGYIANPRIKRN